MAAVNYLWERSNKCDLLSKSHAHNMYDWWHSILSSGMHHCKRYIKKRWYIEQIRMRWLGVTFRMNMIWHKWLDIRSVLTTECVGTQRQIHTHAINVHLGKYRKWKMTLQLDWIRSIHMHKKKYSYTHTNDNEGTIKLKCKNSVH